MPLWELKWSLWWSLFIERCRQGTFLKLANIWVFEQNICTANANPISRPQFWFVLTARKKKNFKIMYISILRPKPNISVVGMVACQNSSKHSRIFFSYMYTFKIHLKQSHLMKKVALQYLRSDLSNTFLIAPLLWLLLDFLGVSPACGWSPLVELEPEQTEAWIPSGHLSNHLSHQLLYRSLYGPPNWKQAGQ